MKLERTTTLIGSGGLYRELYELQAAGYGLGP